MKPSWLISHNVIVLPGLFLFCSWIAMDSTSYCNYIKNWKLLLLCHYTNIATRTDTLLFQHWTGNPLLSCSDFALDRCSEPSFSVVLRQRFWRSGSETEPAWRMLGHRWERKGSAAVASTENAESFVVAGLIKLQCCACKYCNKHGQLCSPRLPFSEAPSCLRHTSLCDQQTTQHTSKAPLP